MSNSCIAISCIPSSDSRSSSSVSTLSTVNESFDRVVAVVVMVMVVTFAAFPSRERSILSNIGMFDGETGPARDGNDRELTTLLPLSSALVSYVGNDRDDDDDALDKCTWGRRKVVGRTRTLGPCTCTVGNWIAARNVDRSEYCCCCCCS